MNFVLLGEEVPRQKLHHPLRSTAAQMRNEQQKPWTWLCGHVENLRDASEYNS
jgi:hypothetical protein